MNIVYTIARILLGLAFFVLGLNGFLHFIPAPPPAGLAGQFLTVLVASHYAYFVFAVQVVAGALLLTGQYVPLAVLMLAPVLANILNFHVTMQPEGLPMALVVTALWVVVAWRYRALFVPIFARKVVPS